MVLEDPMKNPNSFISYIAILSLALILSLGFLVKNCVEKREITKMVQTILKCWINDDISKTYVFWENEEEAPPVYGVISYELTGHILGQKNNKPYAQIFTTIEFTPQNMSPSGKEWVFEVVKTRYGWRVKDFHLNYEKPPFKAKDMGTSSAQHPDALTIP